MKRVFACLGFCVLGAAHCTANAPEATSEKVAPKVLLPPARDITVPEGYVIEHFGDADDLRRLIKVTDPELDKLWAKGSLITLRRDQATCAYARVGPAILPLRPCPEAAPKGPQKTLKLAFHRFGVPLVDGVVPLERAEKTDALLINRAWLIALFEPIGLPLVATSDPVPLRVFTTDEGRGFALEMPLTEDVLAALGRFDLMRRYGGFADYVSDVRAWGDGKKFQWMLRLDGGGVGLRLVGQTLRLAVQSGPKWQETLDGVLRATTTKAVRLPLVQVDGLAVEVDPSGHLRPMAIEKALPATQLLRQLAARLKRWLAKSKEED